MNQQVVAQEAEYKDRSRWLLIVGLVEILIGALCGLIGLSLPVFSRFFRENPATAELASGRMLISNVLMFAALTLLFLWLGIGTMRIRRWARDMMLVTAWLWLIVGTLALVLLYFVLPQAFSEMTAPGQARLSGGEMAAAMTIFTVVMALPYILLPGFFVIFYSGKNVRKTFEIRDPVARWTSKCPLSVLTASQFLAGGAISLLILPFYSNALPFFGRVVSGTPASLIMILAALISGYLAWAIYKLRVQAWWINLVLTLLGLAWLVGSYSIRDLAGVSSNGEPAFRLGGQILNLDFLGGRAWFVIIGILGAAWVAFLLLIKKHFKKPPAVTADL